MKTSLRIGFNMWTHSTTAGGGMVYYALSLLREFCRALPENLVLFYGTHGKDLVSTVKEIGRVRQIELKSPGEIYDNRLLFDVLFSPNPWGGVNMLDYPTVHVIPDIQEQYYPGFFSHDEFELRSTIFQHSAKASTILITISNFSKKTIVEKFGVPEEQIRVTYLAAHPIFSDASHLGTKPAQLPDGIGRYLFYPANSWRHKNHTKLLEGLLELRQNYDMEIPCVFTGHMLNGQSNHVDITREIRNRGLEKQVYHIGTVSLTELKYLYAHAAALICPSLFEGFGLPLVEAMGCGCPIVAANTTSIPEIAGNAGLYFDPNDSADIANRIYHFVNHPDEAEERVIIGKALSRNFSDARCARETLKILENAERVAGIRSLKARSAGARRTVGVVLSILLVFQGPPKKEIIREIEDLFKEFHDSIQFIVIAHEHVGNLITPLLGGWVKITPLRETIRAAVSGILQELDGEYVFLSEGKSVPLQSFIYYLMVQAHEVSFREKGELLHGEWYIRAPGRKRLADAPVTPEGDEEKRKASVCENLAFVVQREAFRRVLRRPPKNPDTLFGIASELWDQCSKTRIYRTVDLRFVKGAYDYNLSIVSRKLKFRIATKPWLRRLLDTRAGNRLLSIMVQTYYRVPAKIQRGIVKIYNIIAVS
ncbi:MAG TPA: glycosyltransferase family 1 protein [Desulfomonilaceae bacterium]|nr:glycosyltransferase family 1 protein [Desulfomonilaceae bacterium]